MAEKNSNKDELVDGMPRDRRGFWQPERGTAPANPIFSWPPRPVAVLKWLYNYLFGWNLFYMVLATVTWLYFQPALERCAEFRADWIAQMFVRNQIMLILSAGGWHVWLWARKSQGLKFKYTTEWSAKGNRKFLWGNQLYDNIFWACVSGGTIWTAYEVLMMWAYANGKLPYVDPRAQPVYFVFLLCCVRMWRHFHFYWSHRITHWPPLYKSAHYLHHKNVNPGPWSGLSMHPIEHLIYFSCILIHWIVPSHPIHMLLNAQATALSPAQGHVGFEKLVAKGDSTVGAASYFHQLHHRYFECNYGEPGFPSTTGSALRTTVLRKRTSGCARDGKRRIRFWSGKIEDR